LVKNYFRAVTEQTWRDKLPTEAVRWSLFTGAGLIVDVLGAGLVKFHHGHFALPMQDVFGDVVH
jgi:hypothetical protein